MFSDVNMKNCGRCNVSKHRDIRGSDKYVTLDISMKFDSMDKTKIKYSESKEKLEISGKGLITYLGFKAKVGHTNKKRQGMQSVRRTFRKLLRSLKNYLIKLMRRRGPNMSLLTDTFTFQDSLKIVRWELMPSTQTFTL